MSLSIFGAHAPIVTQFCKEQEAEQLLSRIQETALRQFKEGHFHRFDAFIGNNQCHLGALRVVRLASQEALSERDKAFLTLSFLTSSCFSHRKELLGSSPLIEPLQDAAKAKLREDFKEHTLERLKALTLGVNQELMQELKRVAADPRAEIFPKFASVLLFLEEHKFNPIPIQVKIKSLCTNGMQLLVHSNFNESNKPHVCFEGLAARKKFKVLKEERSHCFHSLFNRDSTHSAEESCGMCKPCLCPSHSVQLGSFDEMLLASAADFTQTLQSKFVKPFFKSTDFPILSQLFKEALQKAKEKGFAYENPFTLGIEHAFPDLSGRVKRFLDTLPEGVKS